MDAPLPLEQSEGVAPADDEFGGTDPSLGSHRN